MLTLEIEGRLISRILATTAENSILHAEWKTGYERNAKIPRLLVQNAACALSSRSSGIDARRLFERISDADRGPRGVKPYEA